MSAPMLEPLAFSQDNYCAQEQSALFNLPGEIRDRIFAYALAPFEAEDEKSKYEVKSYHARPNYFAPPRSTIQLLQTCQRTYHEAWFRPWTSSQQTIWLTSSDRAPPSRITVERLQDTVAIIHVRHGDIVLDDFRVFAQLWALESSDLLQGYLNIKHFLPRQITITIRHSDCWWWEHDAKLEIDSYWTCSNTFPNSLQVLKFELESLERKKEQVDNVVRQMQSRWVFTRQDQVQLFASHNDDDDNTISRWQGSSTLNGQRWIRDEHNQYPGKLNYYIRSATWRVGRNRAPQEELPTNPGKIIYDGPQEVLENSIANLLVTDLQAAGVADDVPASTALERWNQWALERQATRPTPRGRRSRSVRTRRARAQ